MTAGKRVALLFAVGLMLAVPGWADPIDPTIIVRDGGIKGTIHIMPGQLVTAVFFNTDPRCFQTMLPDPSAPQNLVPSMTCPVVNNSGAVLSSLTFAVTPAQSFFTVSDNSFGTWVTNNDFTLLTFTFATPIPHCPPPPDATDAACVPAEFTIDFVGFSTTNPPSIIMTANVPEPATLGLMLAGLGAVGLLRRRNRRSA